MSKQPFAVLASDRTAKTVTYEASFWEGRYVRRRFIARWFDRREVTDPLTGEHRIIPGRTPNVSPNVSYHSQLLAAFARIGCRP